MTTVFFSIPHSPRMHNLAQECASHLATKGFEVLATECSPFGEQWDAQIWPRIRRADVVVVFFDHPTSAVGIELGFALGAQKQVLLIADSYAQIPSLLADLQILSIGSDCEDLSARLEKAVTQLAGERKSEVISTNDVFHLAAIYRSDPGVLDQMSYQHFENLVEKSFGVLGYDPRPAPRNLLVDFVLHNFEGGRLVAVEIKKWPRSRKVPISVVQRFLGSLHGQPGVAGILLSTAEFTDSAREFAMRTDGQIHLWSFEEVAQRVEKCRR